MCEVIFVAKFSREEKLGFLGLSCHGGDDGADRGCDLISQKELIELFLSSQFTHKPVNLVLYQGIVKSS